MEVMFELLRAYSKSDSKSVFGICCSYRLLFKKRSENKMSTEGNFRKKFAELVALGSPNPVSTSKDDLDLQLLKKCF